jgi:hypothetical protein
MHVADVDADSICFPRKCPHCGGKAAGTYAVAAMRGLDVYAGGYTMPLLLDVPVCREVFDRRRRAALVALVLVLVLVVAAAIGAAVLAWRGAWIAAIVLGAFAGVLAMGGRTGWDAGLLDRAIVGMYARSISSKRLRVGFRDDKYFAEWARLNRVPPRGK